VPFGTPTAGQYSEVTALPSAKEKKDLQLAHGLLRQYCDQMGVTAETATVDTGERNRYGAPVCIASVRLSVGGRQWAAQVPSSSPAAGLQQAERALLLQLLPDCPSLPEVRERLRAHQRQNRKAGAATAREKRQKFIIGLFPECRTIEEARAQLRAKWPSHRERRKRAREEPRPAGATGGPLPGSEEEEGDDRERGERPAKRPRMAMALDDN